MSLLCCMLNSNLLVWTAFYWIKCYPWMKDSNGYPPCQDLMGYPTPPSRTGWDNPNPVKDWMGYPPPPIRRLISKVSTCYAAGGVTLVFTQEDFLVLIIKLSKEMVCALEFAIDSVTTNLSRDVSFDNIIVMWLKVMVMSSSFCLWLWSDIYQDWLIDCPNAATLESHESEFYLQIKAKSNYHKYKSQEIA